MANWVYINGKIVEQQHANIPVDNTGIARAFGVFDLFRTRNKVPTFFDDYLNRFTESQKFLGLSRQISRDEVISAVKDLQEKNRFQDSTFKLILLGDGPDGSPVFDPFFYILNLPLTIDLNKKSIKVITHEYVREYPKIKSLNYMTSFALQRKKTEQDAEEVIYHYEGLVSEASRCNLFIIKDGHLITPNENILHGITRKHVIEAAKSIMDVEIMSVTLDDMLNADEVFVTSTTKEVMPVSHIDGNVVGVGSDWSKKIQVAFRDYLLNIG